MDLVPAAPFPANDRVAVSWANKGHREFCEDAVIRAKLGGRYDKEFIAGLLDTVHARNKLKGLV